PQEADLQLVQAVINPRPNVGDGATFTIILTNHGPVDATGMQVTDLLPAGLSPFNIVASQGVYIASTGAWTVGTVTTTAPQSLTIQARVLSPGPKTNTAGISQTDQFDLNTANNTASISVNPQQADLAVSSTVSNARPNVGDTVTFTVTLTDLGPDTAT